ncbi:hypothetical protein WJX73_007527 [Symbiochloris irregularis]
MAYEVWPVCGDGLDVSVVNRLKDGTQRTLMSHAIAAEPQSKPQRHSVELKLPLHSGDNVDIIVHGRKNHDCDGVFLIDVQFWQDAQGSSRL